MWLTNSTKAEKKIMDGRTAIAKLKRSGSTMVPLSKLEADSTACGAPEQSLAHHRRQYSNKMLEQGTRKHAHGLREREGADLGSGDRVAMVVE
jgi:hypothetical protein